MYEESLPVVQLEKKILPASADAGEDSSTQKQLELRVERSPQPSFSHVDFADRRSYDVPEK
jgi:hypothetical protein